jgi:hypothetical protein
MHINNMQNESYEIKNKITSLEDSLIIKPKDKSRSSGGMDPHYEHTVSLKIKNRTISNTQWDNWDILSLDEKDIQDIYEDRQFYDLKSLKDYCSPKSYEKLLAYFTYMDIWNQKV